MTLDDIKKFRQLDSRCAGHPEYRLTAGVETTTGPLGQGVANSVGMAIAGRWLAATFNRPTFDVFNYRVYAICGDGDMMEGISSEAASLAGHLQLSNLCWIYDSNRISIEGSTSLAFSEDVAMRFAGYGWEVTHVGDANDLDQLGRGLAAVDRTRERPSLIIVDSHIAYGAPHKQDTKEAHGEPLGEEEVRAAKRSYGWPEDAHFLVPEGVREHFDEGIGARGREARSAWQAKLAAYRAQHPGLAAQLDLIERGDLPDGWDHDLAAFPADAKGVATRDSSGIVLNAIAQHIPWLIGGSADLAPSTKTRLTFPDAGDLEANSPGARNMHFGIREHAMTAVANGLAVSGLRPYCSTFLIFSDYAKPSIRLSALMELPVVHVFTHDSIGLGEDGPTHQPIEQLAALRAMPGLITLRPCDANEVLEAWRVIMAHRDGPVALVLSRQALPTLDRSTCAPAAGLAKGAYVLVDAADGDPDVLLLATGSEVSLCMTAHEALRQEGIKARVVSMPSWELFELQSQEYRDSVLPPGVTARVSVEMASTFGWDRYVGSGGRQIGMHTFGASAPLKDVAKKFGFTAEAIVAAARSLAPTRAGA